MSNAIRATSATRDRLDGEITPIGAVQSRTYGDNEAKYAAAHAIDLDLETMSYIKPGDDGTVWLEVKLDQKHCVGKVVLYKKSGVVIRTWTCSQIDCTDCEGSDCSKFLLTVSNEGSAFEDHPADSGCRKGDAVKITKSTAGGLMKVEEMAVFRNEGEANFCWM